MDQHTEIFGGSITDLRDQALQAFNFIVAKETNLPVPPVTEFHKKYLEVSEVEAIIRDHLEDVGFGYTFRCDTREELAEKMETVFSELLMRIRSNIMHDGVKQGYLEPMFDADTNEFDFEVTEKGKSFNNEQFAQFFGIDPGDLSDTDDDSPENN